MENLCKNALSIEEQTEYYNARVKSVLDSYKNPDGREDPLYIWVLKESRYLVNNLTEIINLLSAEVEKLSTRKEVTKCGECQHWDITGHCMLPNNHKTYGGFCDEAVPKDKEKS